MRASPSASETKDASTLGDSWGSDFVTVASPELLVPWDEGMIGSLKTSSCSVWSKSMGSFSVCETRRIPCMTMLSISESVSLSNTKTLREVRTGGRRLGTKDTYRHRLKRAALSLNEGFSVVAPISYMDLGSVRRDKGAYSRNLPGRALVRRMGGIRPLTAIRPVVERSLVDVYLLSFVEPVDLIEEDDRLSRYPRVRPAIGGERIYQPPC